MKTCWIIISCWWSFGHVFQQNWETKKTEEASGEEAKRLQKNINTSSCMQRSNLGNKEKCKVRSSCRFLLTSAALHVNLSEAGSWFGFEGWHTRKRARGHSWFSPSVCSGLWGILDVDDAQVHGQHLQMCLCDVPSDGLEALRWVQRVKPRWARPSGRLTEAASVLRACQWSSGCRERLCICVKSLLFPSTQHRRSPSDTSACLYGTTADTRCVSSNSKCCKRIQPKSSERVFGGLLHFCAAQQPNARVLGPVLGME